jgi:tetratricopeptide (TPR) repeat protein
LRRVGTQPGFALVNLFLVLASGVVWIFTPELGIWFTLLALLSSGALFLSDRSLLKRIPYTWLLAVFLITASIGYWAAYDKSSGWIKLWLIITAVLLYYALGAQPKQNLLIISLLSFCLGLGAAVYFFLTFDFAGISTGIALWWIRSRPYLGWQAIHHGYTSGLLLITTLFAFYWLQNIWQKSFNKVSAAPKIFAALGFGVILLAFILTVSRGLWFAAACGLGAWVLWRIMTLERFAKPLGIKSLFPWFVLLYLGAIVIIVYLGPARTVGAGQGEYGNNTRAEVFERGTYFLLEYPITGSGLDSFPGLYSQYVLVIPHFYYINSYNVFLDVAIEQGLAGGLALILVYLGSLWLAARAIVKAESNELRFPGWLSLFALIVTILHGLFYDYLYNGAGTVLLLFPVGMTTLIVGNINRSTTPIVQPRKAISLPSRAMIIIPILGIVVLLALNLDKLAGLWYADLGAVQMSQVELKHFPTNEWATSAVVPELTMADASLRSALRYDPNNQTANYRLGLISMLRQDFRSAAVYLEKAHERSPYHRGIIKNLGYCYVWLGEMDKAKALLEQIPESQQELDVYSWWWNVQGRQDLAINAFEYGSRLDLQSKQP